MRVIAGRPGKMILLRPKSIRFGLVLLAVFLVAFEQPAGVSAAEVALGEFKGCAHDLAGKVVAVHKKKIKITGFKYDGTAPATWFHAMKSGKTNVYDEPKADYDAISNSLTQCERLKPDKVAITDGTVELSFPNEITTYESIGLFCHWACANFGSLKLDHKGKAYDEVPTGEAEVAACPIPDKEGLIALAKGIVPAGKEDTTATPCTVDKVAHKEFDKCDGGGGDGMGDSSTGASGAGDVAASMGCIAGGVFAVGLLNARK